MEESLLDKLTQELPKRRKTCIKNILILVEGILLKESICLNKIKGVVGTITGKVLTKPDSHYKRLIRIFDEHACGTLWLELLGLVFRLLRLKSDYLLLDGTSWERGSRQFHYLTLCVVYQGVAIPIYWQDLQKKGSSSIEERKRVMSQAQRYYKLSSKVLLADREYVGEEWFSFLREQKIDFVIRLRKKNYKEAVNAAEGKSYGSLERKALRSRKAGKALGKTIRLQGHAFNFVVLKNPKVAACEPLIYLLSSLEQTPAQIAAHYPIRWQIETCFKHLKSNGFNLEEMNLAGPQRSRLMMAIVVFAYTLSVVEGLKAYEKVAVKTYAQGIKTRAVSVFRRGLDMLSAYCYTIETFLNYLVENLITKLPAYRSRQTIFV
jgi:hypothetical protein